MASQTLRVILDDNAGDIQYGGGTWTVSTLVQWYQHTSNYPAFVGNGAFGSLTLTFEGISIAFIGNIPTSDFDQFATFSIDGGEPYNATYGNMPPPAYIQWYQTPTLSDGKHTITVDHLDGTAIDMALITVGPNTSLANKNIFVDDSDPAVQYTGHWINDSSGFNAGTLPDGQSIGNTTRRSTNVGDTMSFQFSGTSISIYGIFSWSNIGSVSATYTIDGAADAQTYSVTTNSPEHVSADGDAVNFRFYEKELSAGNHTLVVNITDIENQTFIFDYMVYSPSFSSLAAMPNLTSTQSTTTTTTSMSSTTSPTTGTGATQVPTKTRTTSTPVGAIVGGVVGGVLLVALILMFSYFHKRSRRSQTPPFNQHILVPYLPNDKSSGPQMAGLPTSVPLVSSTENVTPFPMDSGHLAFASVSDLKRDRMEQEGPSSGRAASSPAGQARSDGTSHDSSQRNFSPAPPSTARTDALEYVPFDAVPPAYEALSTHPVSSPVTPTSR